MEGEGKMEHFDLVIVGTGFYGLALAKTYIQVNPTCKLLVLDAQNSVGGTWAAERLYEHLVTNNIAGNFQYSDYPLEAKEWNIENEKYSPGTTIHRYFTSYAQKFGVFDKIRFNSTVQTAELLPDDTWIITYLTELDEKRVAAKKFVLATGTTYKPMVPRLNGADVYRGKIFHTKELAHSQDVIAKAKHITVLGGSKSAADAVYLNAIKGRKVDWVVRESGRGPSWMVQSWATPLKLWFEKLTTTRLLSWFSPSPDDDGYPRARWFLQNTWLGLKINAALWYLINDDVSTSAGFKKHPETHKLLPWHSIFWWGIQVGVFNYPTDFLELIRDGTVTVRVGDITFLTEDGIKLSNGDDFPSDLLICATGWHMGPTVQIEPREAAERTGPVSHSPTDPTITKIDAEIKSRYPILTNQPITGPSHSCEQPSYELYRGCIPPSFISTRNFAWQGMNPNLSGTITAGIQALWLTAFLDNKLDTPPEELYTESELKYEVVRLSRFWRWRSPLGVGTVMPDMVFEVLPYYDTLLRDLGLSYRRKSGWREILQPYSARDYRGLVVEWLAKEKKQN